MRQKREMGEDRLRPLYSQPYAVIDLSWDFSDTEYATFNEWFYRSVASGTRRFDIQLSDRMSGLDWYTVQFIGRFRVVRSNPGGRWQVTSKLLGIGEPFAIRDGATDLYLGSLSSASSNLRGALRGFIELSAIDTLMHLWPSRLRGRLGGDTVELYGILASESEARLVDYSPTPPLYLAAEASSDLLGELVVGP